MPKCECGCGRDIEPKRQHKYGGGGRFIPGHQFRGAAHRRYTPKTSEIPSGLCECGCGKKTNIATNTHRARRFFRGHPVPYLPGHAPYRFNKREARGNWKGGRIYNRGYVLLYMPDDPRSDVKGYYPEHRFVWEEAHGRLGPGMDVHHINQIKDDNRLENLEALTHEQHRAEHREEQQEIARRTLARTPTYASDIGKKGAAARWKGHVKKLR